MLFRLVALLAILTSIVHSFVIMPKADHHSSLNSANCSNKLPSAVIIGVKKSGTYALLRYLSLNSQIKPALKINNCNLNEIHYFDQDENYYRGLDWYKKQMPKICYTKKDKPYVVMEKTPGYFRSEKAAQRMKIFNPNLKLILIVRNPVKRLKSELTHCDTRQKKLNLTRKCSHLNSFFEDLFKNRTLSDRELENELLNNKFIRNSVYYLDLIKWIKYFSSDQLYVLDGEKFIRRPWQELNKIENFLNLTNNINQNQFYFDRNKNFYCINEKHKSKFFHDLNPLIVKKEMDGCLGKNKGRKNHVYLSDLVRVNLERFFKKWNKLFFDTIDQTFDW
jgi:hypothetical protein